MDSVFYFGLEASFLPRNKLRGPTPNPSPPGKAEHWNLPATDSRRVGQWVLPSREMG